jgi:hypothetical protein
MIMDLQSELNAAVAERDELQADLGQAILDGRPVEAIQKKLAKAEAAVEAAEIAKEAIARAHQRSAERAADKTAVEAAAERAKRWKQAETDLHDLHATVSAKDRLLEKLAELNRREESQSRTFVANYADLGMSAQSRDELLLRSWNGQLIQKLKTDVGLGSYIPKLLTYGVPGRAVAACVPAFAKVFRKAPKLALEHKEAA